jgi:hypothetical protein
VALSFSLLTVTSPVPVCPTWVSQVNVTESLLAPEPSVTGTLSRWLPHGSVSVIVCVPLALPSLVTFTVTVSDSFSVIGLFVESTVTWKSAPDAAEAVPVNAGLATSATEPALIISSVSHTARSFVVRSSESATVAPIRPRIPVAAELVCREE